MTVVKNIEKDIIFTLPIAIRPNAIIKVKGGNAGFTLTIHQKKNPDPNKIKELQKFATVMVGKENDSYVISIATKGNFDKVTSTLYEILKILNINVDPPIDYLSFVSYLKLIESYGKEINEQNKQSQQIKISATFLISKVPNTVEIYTHNKEIFQKTAKPEEKMIEEYKMFKMKGVKGGSKEKVKIYYLKGEVSSMQELYDFLKKNINIEKL